MIGKNIYGVVINENGSCTIYGVIGMKLYYMKENRAIKSYNDSVFYANKK